MISYKCLQFNSEQLVYQSSEQYLMLCLQICNLIVNDKCHITQLIDFNRYSTTKTSQEQLQNDSKSDLSQTDIIQQSFSTSLLPQLLSHLNETECKKYASRESYKLSLFICGIILCFLILCLNAVTLVTIIRSRRLRTVSNILIANLSLSDFLAGLAFLYPCTLNLLTINALENYNSYLYEIACNIRQFYYLCLVGYSPMITSMLTSILTLTLLAMEKYMAILHPYIYERLIQDRKSLCYLCLLLVWTISIFFSLLPMMGWNEHKYSTYRGFSCNHAQSKPCMFERIFTLDYILSFTSICGLCAMLMLAMYIRIYFIARAHSKQINRMKSSFKEACERRQHKSVDHADQYPNEQLNQDPINLNKIESYNLEVIDNSQKMCEPYRDQKKATSLLKSFSSSTSSVTSLKIAKSVRRVVTSTTTVAPQNSKTVQVSKLAFISTLRAIVDETLKNWTTNKTTSTRTTANVAQVAASESTIVQDFSNSNDEILDGAKNVSNIPRTSSSSGSIGDLVLVNIPCNRHLHTGMSSHPHHPIPGRIATIPHTGLKAMRALLILCLGFYLCWLPLIIYFLTFASKQYDNMTIYVLMFVACCNAVIDPLVYAFNNREFCKTFVNRFHRRRH